MADPSGGNITLSIATVTFAALSAGAAWAAAFYSRRFTRKQLNAQMHQEYADMSDTRAWFWALLIDAYQHKRESWHELDLKFPEKLHDFALQVPPPPVEGDVVEYVKDNVPPSSLDQRPHKMWELASFVYPQHGDIDHMFDDGRDYQPPRLPFHDYRGRLAWFWDKWRLVLKPGHITEHYDSAKQEVYLLVWLELALAQKIGQPGKGKRNLFRLAREFQDANAP